MADQNLIPFQFGTHSLSVLTDEAGNLWWIGQEVCEALEVSNVSQAFSRLDADEKSDIILNDAAGRPNKTLIISEHGLYKLTLSSRKKAAKTFQRWVIHEVLPQIRKTGSYQMTSTLPTLHDPAYQAMLQMVVEMDTMKHTLAEIEMTQKRQHEELIAQQATIIQHFLTAQQANTKADLALTQQQWITLRQYVFVNNLARQLPSSLMNEYGKWLTGYCLEQNIPISREQIADRPYDAENSYHVGTIEATLPAWRLRREGQGSLMVLPKTPRGKPKA